MVNIVLRNKKPTSPGNPVAALIKERSRAFTPDEQKYFQNEVNRVAQMMKMRNAPAKEINDLKMAFLTNTPILKSKGPKI
jgi:hypothetical protein